MGHRLLGIDFGLSRIGVAVSDPTGIATRPLGFVPRQDDAQAARVVAALARQERVGGLVFGLPLNADGSQGDNVRWVRAFQSAVGRVCDLPQHEIDERYSTSEAEEALRAEGRWPARPGDLDAKAAAILLRRFLDQPANASSKDHGRPSS